MPTIKHNILEQLVCCSGEPILLTRVDQSEWPIVLANPAFEAFADRSDLLNVPVADLVESLHGRDAARELSETIRSGQASTIPIDARGRNWLLVLKPIRDDNKGSARYYAACWRDSATMTGGGDASAAHQALLRARRRIRDLSRDDSLTGLLNEAAFHEVLAHDWAVAARDQRPLALIAFRIDHFDAYLKVFGRHAADSCLRRVAQTMKRCLRRASDVATRLIDGEDEVLVVLCQADDQQALDRFARSIAGQVRDLGLHHPHSKKERFITVSTQSAITAASGDVAAANSFLKSVLSR
jgi:diguanylate cyclase (GGDEF)-like protein